MDGLYTTAAFPHLQAIFRLGLALGLGLFVGLEREWRHKDAGLRTFGFAALLGALGGVNGESFALVSLALLGLLLTLMNWQVIRRGDRPELTTSAALLVTGYVGVLCGVGHTFTPVVVTIATAGLLAWKEQLADFSLGLTATELRSAILLAVLAFVIYPVLP
ncbi:MAG TPA: MgtC/SapB family protein, partial [Myxococcales bacterium]|nr:MgtC/SapB family protein [Myxococcales bacterium]